MKKITPALETKISNLFSRLNTLILSNYSYVFCNTCIIIKVYDDNDKFDKLQ